MMSAVFARVLVLVRFLVVLVCSRVAAEFKPASANPLYKQSSRSLFHPGERKKKKAERPNQNGGCAQRSKQGSRNLHSGGGGGGVVVWLCKAAGKAAEAMRRRQ
jgi:hypothetical protein